ncbi:MAG: citramalate synthase [Candidatus Aenigmarchaeota archaeon]|nr:citramalate synthase [Candidatus Aenigmarchaeota archaeon]
MNTGLDLTKVHLYDTTLRDGAQTSYLNLSLEGKLGITKLLTELGIPYIEGGFVGSNPRDMTYFQKVRELELDTKITTRIAAFGMTSRTENIESNMQPFLQTNADIYTVVGKTHRGQVKTVLRYHDPKGYLRIIEDSVAYLKSQGRPVFFDAEHSFDGYKLDPDYTLASLEAAKRGEADILILCDTNGGNLPTDIYDITSQIVREFGMPIGIHCHDDRGYGIANSMAGVKAGAIQVQGTMNGLGERVGNANLTTLLVELYREGYPVITESNLRKLTRIAREVGRLTGRRVSPNAPYVGEMAFSHAAGMHSDAMIKDPTAYEHISPETVGNKRYFPLSEQSGKAAVRWWTDKYGFKLSDEQLQTTMNEVNTLQNFGEAQTYLLLHRVSRDEEMPFELLDCRTTTIHTSDPPADVKEATVKVMINGNCEHEVADGDGPVNALDLAMRKALRKYYPKIEQVELIDYWVDLPSGEKGTQARVDVSITFKNDGEEFTSRSSGTDIIEASRRALEDGYKFYLLKEK